MFDDLEEWYARHKVEHKCAEAKLNATTIIIASLLTLIFFFIVWL